MEEGKWICILLNHQYSKKDSLEVVRKEMKKVFEDDYVDILVASSDRCDTEGFGNYAFVKSLNYSRHIIELRKSRVIFNVLPSYKKPHYLSEEEVFSFKDSAENQNRTGELFYGDLVKIEDGYLKNLYGMVESKNEDGTYKVFFKLYTMKFHENLSPKLLTFKRNIFDKVRVPVLDYNDGHDQFIKTHLGESFNDKMHRTEYREHGTQGVQLRAGEDSDIYGGTGKTV